MKASVTTLMADRSQTCGVQDAIITDELARRPSKPADYKSENDALCGLAATMAAEPDEVLQHLVDLAKALTNADSAGVSLLESCGDQEIFRWVATAGEFRPHLNGTMPRDASPCGEVVSRRELMLFREPGRAFPELRAAKPTIHEGLLAPFEIDGRPAGTVWVIKHDPEGRFDSEDARKLQSLARFASAAHQLASSTRTARQAKEASESKYRLLFDSIDEGFCIIEVLFDEHNQPLDYRFLEVNGAFERQTGLLDAVGKSMREMAPDHEQHWFDIYGGIALTGTPARFEKEAAALGRWYDVYAFRTGDPDKHHVAILFHEISDRKRIEEALRESEERLAAAFQSVPVGVAVINASGTAVTANAQYLRFLPTGVIPSRDPARAERWRAWDAQGKPLEPRNFPGGRALRGESVLPGQEMLYIDDDGREIWTSVATAPIRNGDGHVTGAVTVINDIDVAKRSAMALSESESRLQLIQDSLREYAIITVDRGGLVTSWNVGAERLLGYSEEEAVGMDGRLIFTPEDRASGEPDLEITTAMVEGRAANERWHLRKDGSRFWGSGAVLRMHNGHQKGAGEPLLVKIMRDETARRERDEALQDSEQHQRLLLAELQHRVRNTLSVIRSIVRRTAERSKSAEDLGIHLDGRLGAFARVQAIVTRDPGRPIDLAELIGDELVAHAAADPARYKGPDIALPSGIAERLSLAFHELATNSVKYGALGARNGDLSISWSLTEREGIRRLRIEWTETGLDDPLPEPQTEGFGTELLRRSLPYELKAEVELDYRPEGLRAVIDVPLGPAADAQ